MSNHLFASAGLFIRFRQTDIICMPLRFTDPPSFHAFALCSGRWYAYVRPRVSAYRRPQSAWVRPRPCWSLFLYRSFFYYSQRYSYANTKCDSHPNRRLCYSVFGLSASCCPPRTQASVIVAAATDLFGCLRSFGVFFHSLLFQLFFVHTRVAVCVRTCPYVLILHIGLFQWHFVLFVFYRVCTGFRLVAL